MGKNYSLKRKGKKFYFFIFFFLSFFHSFILPFSSGVQFSKNSSEINYSTNFGPIVAIITEGHYRTRICSEIYLCKWPARMSPKGKGVVFCHKSSFDHFLT